MGITLASVSSSNATMKFFLLALLIAVASSARLVVRRQPGSLEYYMNRQGRIGIRREYSHELVLAPSFGHGGRMGGGPRVQQAELLASSRGNNMGGGGNGGLFGFLRNIF